MRRAGPGSPSRAHRDRPALFSDVPAFEAVYDRALALLAGRSYGRVELSRRLVRHGYPAPDVDAAVERLVAAGLLDDAAYARQLARSKLVDRGQSGRRVRRELSARGIADTVAAAALAEVAEDEGVDEAATAARLARRRVGALVGLPVPTQRRRLFGFLARRGYDPDVARRAVSLALGRPDDDPSLSLPDS